MEKRSSEEFKDLAWGVELVRQHRYREARPILQRQLERKVLPHSLQMLAFRALLEAEIDMGDLRAAEELIERFGDLAAERQAAAVVARLHVSLGRYQDADALLRTADPDDRSAMKVRATMLEAQGRRKEAEQLYREYADRSREELVPAAGLSLARALERKFRFSEAEQEFLQALRDAPESGFLNATVGEFYIRRRKITKAEHYIQKALESEPDLQIVKLAQVRLVIAKRNYEEALTLLEAIEGGERIAEIWALKARCLLGLKRREQALDAAKQALALDPRALISNGAYVRVLWRTNPLAAVKAALRYARHGTAVAE